MSTQEQKLLILYGAPSGPERRVVHLMALRGGIEVPRCNSHIRASQDIGPRRYRDAEGDELEYPICRRCLHMREDGGTMPRYQTREAVLEAHPTTEPILCTICNKWHAT